MLVTEFGMSTETSPVQLPKVPSPMLVTEQGMTTETRLVQNERAYSSMLVTAYSIPSYVTFSGIMAAVIPYMPLTAAVPSLPSVYLMPFCHISVYADADMLQSNIASMSVAFNLKYFIVDLYYSLCLSAMERSLSSVRNGCIVCLF